MTLALRLAIGLAGSLAAGGLAVLLWREGTWAHRNLPLWTDWPGLFLVLALNAAGWVVAVTA